MKKTAITIIALIMAALLCIGCNTAPINSETTPGDGTTAAPETTNQPISTTSPETTEGAPASSGTSETTLSATPETTLSATPETTVAPDTSEATNPTDTTESPDTQPMPETTATTDTQPIPETTAEIGKEEDPEGLSINGVALKDYVIVYADGCSDYEMRAANYIRNEIQARTGIRLLMTSDGDEAVFDHEIVVGETARDISAKLDADTEGVQFSLMASDGDIALEGDYFVIAAAAYYFVETYVGGNTALPTEATVCEPIVKEAKNFIILIGDGMGLYQTLLFDAKSASDVEYSDGEDLFYGYMLPYMGFARTDSLSGVTDSAAAGTALASGYKTQNGSIGKQGMGRDVKSLTEIAASLGMATAVMSTEPQTGATPSSFSAHANNRTDTDVILASQKDLVEKYGTIIKCDFNYYNKSGIQTLEGNITSTLSALSENEKGFFIMYEEAHIDKHCHSNDMTSTFKAVVRFNQAIGVFMEYAFYNPETFVLITADHETGKLLPNGKGSFSYGSGDHTAMYVPVFTYGDGGELFDGKTIENIQIPKTVASFWGYSINGTNSDKYPSLVK